MTDCLAFVVCTPWAAKNSNGIAVIVKLAKIASDIGIRSVIVPGHSLTPCYLGDNQRVDGVQIEWSTPLGATAIVCDTINEERLHEVRQRSKDICHYLLAPSGFFLGKNTSYVPVLAGERVVTYSPQVSTILPYRYIQSNFPLLSSHVNHCRRKKGVWQRGTRDIIAGVYAGKGRIRPLLSKELTSRICYPNIKLITRNSPNSKAKLYALVSSLDLLISFDPITSLNHEAILLGTPVLVVPPWDEPGFELSFPVSLEGISWGSESQAIDFVINGYNRRYVYESYLDRCSSVVQDAINLFDFIRLSAPLSSASANKINSYWLSRNVFFNALSLPTHYEDDSLPGIKIIKDFNVYTRLCYGALVYKRAITQLLLLPVKMFMLFAEAIYGRAFKKLLWRSRQSRGNSV